MFLRLSLHAAFEQFLYFLKKPTKNSLFPYRTPEGLKLQEEKVGEQNQFSLNVWCWVFLQ